jgi:hypothetical protein
VISSRAGWLLAGALFVLAGPALAQDDPEFAKMAREAPAAARFSSSLLEDSRLAPLSLPTPSSLGSIGTWIMRPPPVLYGACTVYDPLNDRLVVACGSNGFFQKNVWTLSLTPGSTWQMDSLASAQAPASFAYAAAAYDPVHARMVMFGGLNTSGGSNQVWSLSLSSQPTWTPVTVEGTPPSPRWNAVSAYDSRRNRLLVYGGETADSLVGDAWALELGDTLRWTRLDPAGSRPLSRGEGTGAYDPVADRLLIYGGYVFNGSQSLIQNQEIWQLSLGDTVAWQRIIPAKPGPPNYERPFWTPGCAAMFDAARGCMYVFGGQFTDEDSWALNMAANPPVWSKNPALPLRRQRFTPVYDARRDCYLLYGGADSGHDDCDVDVLTFSGGPAWSSLGTRAIPTGRDDATTIFDSRHDRMVMFGGQSETADLTDTWAMSLPTGAWTQLATSGSKPSNGISSEGVYDSNADRFFLFESSESESGPYDELWVLGLDDLSATWHKVQTQGDPPPFRINPSLVYDPLRNRLLLFGGFDFGKRDYIGFNDVWSLSLQEDPPRWTDIHTLGLAPLPRARSSAVYDPASDRMLVCGGVIVLPDHRIPTTEMWALSLGPTATWSPILPQGYGPIGESMPMMFDPARQRFLVYAGPGNFNGTMWALNLKGQPSWEWLPAVGGTVPGRGGVNIVYDTVANRLVLFGGSDNIGDRNDLWTLDFSPDVTPPGAWLLSASAHSGTVNLAWGTGAAAGAQATVFRESAQNTWMPIAQVQADDFGEIRYVDATPENRWTQTYRLGIERDGAMTYSSPITVKTNASHPQLSNAYPNPWRGGAFQFQFQLPSPEPAHLEMLDVRGRVVWSTDVTPKGPAPETFHASLRPRSGLYLLRISQAGDQATLKTVVLQ